ncbi:MAG: hypothetical protein R3Y54_01290 [Eubacteriales bacterium]
MTNYTAITSTYNHFSPVNYKQKSSSSKDSHKKSELKNVCNDIRQLYKESPTYLVDTSLETKESVVHLKDTALQFNNSLTSFSDISGQDMTEHQIGFSSNEDIATVKYLGSSADSTESFQLEVLALSQSQVNIGSLLPSNNHTDLAAGTYIFNVGANEYNYEFSFHVNEQDTNSDIQNRLSNVINNSNIGISASILADSSSQSALRLESNATGLPLGKSELFTVTPQGSNPNGKNAQFISYFGLNSMTQPASNSQFLLNGIERTTTSNTFRVDNNTYEVTLTGISPMEGMTATIGVAPDTEVPHATIKNFVSQVNNFTDYIQNYGQKFPKAMNLLRDVNAAYHTYQNNFSSVGLEKDDTGNLVVDEKQLNSSLQDTEEADNFSQFSSFAKDLSNITKKISIHPMQYSEEKMIDYKNPTKPALTSPYMTSAYSGFLFNSYC